MYTMPFATAGDDSPMPRSAEAARYFHLGLPVAMSSAMSSPVPAPTYAVPSAMAADDSTGAVASNVHSSRSDAGSEDAATPESAGVFRNCDHVVGAGAVCAAASATARLMTIERSVASVLLHRGSKPTAYFFSCAPC